MKLGLDWEVGSSRRMQAIVQERSCNEAGHHPLLEIGNHKRISDQYLLTHSLDCLRCALFQAMLDKSSVSRRDLELLLPYAQAILVAYQCETILRKRCLQSPNQVPHRVTAVPTRPLTVTRSSR